MPRIPGETDLARSIEAEAEQESDRVHMPASSTWSAYGAFDVDGPAAAIWLIPLWIDRRVRRRFPARSPALRGRCRFPPECGVTADGRPGAQSLNRTVSRYGRQLIRRPAPSAEDERTLGQVSQPLESTEFKRREQDGMVKLGGGRSLLSSVAGCCRRYRRPRSREFDDLSESVATHMGSLNDDALGAVLARCRSTLVPTGRPFQPKLAGFAREKNGGGDGIRTHDTAFDRITV